MLTKKLLLAVLIAAGSFGAAVTPLTSVADVVYVDVAPPADRFEAVPVQRSGYIWAPGYWDYRNNTHVWVGGTSLQVREGYTYTPHRWMNQNGRWTLQQGDWHRAANP